MCGEEEEEHVVLPSITLSVRWVLGGFCAICIFTVFSDIDTSCGFVSIVGTPVGSAVGKTIKGCIILAVGKNIDVFVGEGMTVLFVVWYFSALKLKIIDDFLNLACLSPLDIALPQMYWPRKLRVTILETCSRKSASIPPPSMN